MANGLCLACRFDSHSVGDCPHKRTGNVTPIIPALSVSPVRKNIGPVGRGASLPPQQRTFSQAQKGTRAAKGRGKGQACNLTAKEAGSSKELVAGKILAHFNLVLALFDSGVSHCFISDSFTALHFIPLAFMDNLKVYLEGG